MQDQSERVWDAIVVGAGMGGCFAALELGRRGLSVLVLESGSPPLDSAPSGGRLKRILDKLLDRDAAVPPGRWPDKITVQRDGRLGGTRRRHIPAMMGTGPGGSTLVYGAALPRFRRSDFERNTSPERGDGAGTPYANAWPLPYDGMSPFYGEAESLLRVAGAPDPLDPDNDAPVLVPPPPLGPRDGALAARLAANGRHPYRLPVGFDYRVGCWECLGMPCPRGCKADGMSRALDRAIAEHDVHLETGVRAAEIAADADRLTVLATGPEGTVRHAGRSVVLGAGALNTPLLLARSRAIWPDGVPPAVLGRGLMFHVSDMFAVFDSGGHASFGPRKTLAFRDHYEDDGVPLGEVQSMGVEIRTGTVAGYLMDEARRMGFGWAGPALHLLRIPAAIAAKTFADATLFATILEDFPYPANRVRAGEPGERDIVVEYRVSRELMGRARRLRRLVRESFAPERVAFLSLPGTPNWGHPCGTCRMGADPDSSVLTPGGHLWHDERIVVADASAFPSSGGANPSLTVAAHALRVSRALAGRLGGGNA